MPPVDLETLDEGAEHYPLGKSRHSRAGGEGTIPEQPEPFMLEAELERDPAEDEREQHDEYGKIDRWNDDGEGEGESREQAKPAEHQPGFVAVPDRCDRIHDDPSCGLVRGEAVEDANTEIETIEDNIIEDRQRQQRGPQWDEIEDHVHSPRLGLRPCAGRVLEGAIGPAAFNRLRPN